MSAHFDFAKVSDEILVQVFLLCLQRLQVPHKVLGVIVIRVVSSDDARAPIFLQCPDEEVNTCFRIFDEFVLANPIIS